MTPLKKYIWLVDTLMRAGDTGLTIRQISDAFEYADEIGNGEKYNGRTFHRHRNEVKDIFGIEIECYQKGADFRYRIADRSLPSLAAGFYRRKPYCQRQQRYGTVYQH